MDEIRYTFGEVANKLGVSISSVWRWHIIGVKNKKLKSVLVGGRRYVTQSQLDEFCNFGNASDESKLRQNIAKQKLNARRV